LEQPCGILVCAPAGALSEVIPLDRLTRKELKTDKFAQEVTHSLEYVAGHRKQATTYAIAAVVAVLAIAGFWFWRNQSHKTRQHDLAMSLRLLDSVVMQVPQPDDPRPVFATKDEKSKAIRNSFNDVINRYPGSNEAHVAHFHLGVLAADEGNLGEAEKHFKVVADGGDEQYASSAKLSLSQVYLSQGKPAEAERLLRDLIANPTTIVSKEQATVALARVLAPSKPADARKLLEPLQKDERAAVSRNATQVLNELPPAMAPAAAPQKK
jgi:predicted negative regulator of RcsB-dependent stress response